MARIPDAELAQLKKEISLVRLIESQGHALQKSGKDFVMRCLFHQEDTPSLTISPGKNLYHCFGCGAGGGVIDWVMATQGVSFTHAIMLLREGANLTTSKIGVARSRTSALSPILEQCEEDDQALLHRVLKYYQGSLKRSQSATDYLTQRGLTHPELIDTFGLGYVDRTLTYRLPGTHTQTGHQIRQQLRQVGLLRETGYEHLAGCLIVPIIGAVHGMHFDQAGRIQQLYGRRIASRDKQTMRHFYLPRPQAGIWNEAALIAERDIILCEALIDAMTFWCAGYRNVISAYGVNGFTEQHWQALRHYGTRRIWIAYDRDEAGERAAEQLVPPLSEAGIETWRVEFPKGMDANAYACSVGPATQSLGLALTQAQWLGKGKKPSVIGHRHSVAIEVPDAPSMAQLLNEPSLTTLSATNERPDDITEQLHVIKQSPSQDQALAQNEPSDEVPPVSSLAATAPASSTEVAPEVTQTEQGELIIRFGIRSWHIRGWKKNTHPDTMKINLQVRQDNRWHSDTLDLYAARARAAYLKAASNELHIEEEALKRELGAILLKLELMQDGAQAQAASAETAPSMNLTERTAALHWLTAPELIARLENDLAACGLVGEADNLLAGYLATTSRKLDSPLAILVQSTSAAGKSSLMDTLLNLMPTEERLQYSAMTGQSLYYLGETNLQHKILAIAEEEGVRQAAYALKLLQSDGELTIASTGKDEATGNLTTRQYTVKGPVMLMLTTTAIDIDEELLNRCLVLTINETREQTEAIHARQRHKQTLAGLIAQQNKSTLTTLHQNIQRLLKPYAIVNPYAEALSFTATKTRTRRDHMKYLTIINAIALLHQHQRPIQTLTHAGGSLEYLEVQLEDIELANRLAHRILGKTLDEMPPQTRTLLRLIHKLVAQRMHAESLKQNEVRVTRRDIREATGWSDGQLKIHCTRLTDMEYLLIHGGSRGHLLQYELLYDGQIGDQAHLDGLIDVKALDNETRKSGQQMRKLGEDLRKSAPSQSQVSPKSDSTNSAQSQNPQDFVPSQVRPQQNAVYTAQSTPTSSLAAAGEEPTS